MRGLRGPGAAALVVALLGGCSLLGGGDEPAPTEEGRSGPTAEPETQGPPPDELWEQVLDAAEAGLEAPAVGTGTGTTASGATHTVEVLGVRRDDTATLVTLRWSADTEDAVGPVEFRDERYDGQNFGRSMALVDDEVSGQRYLPLQFDDYREACTCPNLPLQVGPQPLLVTATFPPLPDGVTTVDLVIGREGFVSVPDLLVTG